jgi:hypothetical protein
MAIVKLKAGETVLVSAVKSGEAPDQGLPPGGQAPVDPGYGIDLGLGYLRPTHPIAPGGPAGAPPHPAHPIVKPGEPTHPIQLPPAGPADPDWGIDQDIGYLRPDNTLPQPMPPAQVPNWEVKVAWTPTTGWIVVAVPTGEHVTPSKKK